MKHFEWPSLYFELRSQKLHSQWENAGIVKPRKEWRSLKKIKFLKSSILGWSKIIPNKYTHKIKARNEDGNQAITQFPLQRPLDCHNGRQERRPSTDRASGRQPIHIAGALQSPVTLEGRSPGLLQSIRSSAYTTKTFRPAVSHERKRPDHLQQSESQVIVRFRPATRKTPRERYQSSFISNLGKGESSNSFLFIRWFSGIYFNKARTSTN